MAMALSGPAGYFDVTYAAWADILELAEQYGWAPSCTEPPEGVALEDWTGTYCSSDGQLVTEPDASALAAALDAFLSGKPPSGQPGSSPNPEKQRFRGFLSDVAEHLGSPLLVPGGVMDESKAWTNTDDGRAFLSKFAAYCRAGAFRLW
ncbi:hypothetical protein WMF30_48640 [Sorangium sp. So ce134]